MKRVLIGILLITIVVSLPLVGLSCSKNQTDYWSAYITGEDWNEMTLAEKEVWINGALDKMVAAGELATSEILSVDYYITKLDEVYEDQSKNGSLVAWELTAFTQSSVEVPPNFITTTLANFAIGLVDQGIGEDILNMEYVSLTFIVIKLCDTGQPAYTPDGELTLTLELVDDNNETYENEVSLYTLGYRDLPRGFVWRTMGVLSNAPKLAYGHIKSIRLGGNIIKQTYFHMPDLGDTKLDLHFGETIHPSKLVTVTLLYATVQEFHSWGEEYTNVALAVQVHNSSYNQLNMDLSGGSQKFDGEMPDGCGVIIEFEGDSLCLGGSDNAVMGGSSTRVHLVDTGLDATSKSSARAYFLSIGLGGDYYFFIIHPDV